MSKLLVDQSNEEVVTRVLTIDLDNFVEIAKALSTDLRVAIFKKLLERPMNVVEIAEMFNIPPSTAAVNIKKLEDANLIRTEMVPGTRGTQKICAAVFSRIIVETNAAEQAKHNDFIEISMPIGHFFDFQVSPTCGILSDSKIIGELDDPSSFLEPERTNAQLIWFRHGFVEYRFPNRLPHGAKVNNLELLMEICSEAPLHNPNWPSDITLWINGIEVGTWTCPGDFGGERGVLTPSWWSEVNTQFGLLKTWRVTDQCSFIDGRPISDVTLDDLSIDQAPFITVRIGVKPDAVNDGGINLFGRKFGNYETDLVMRLGFVR
ncbi:helix-turn-helix domain-containing protein [Saccharococcus caldoxylosilyticus]|uniref:ArsR/SmtB family transcription factor n=1 Tax=Saccharococcus caldoxylosilyticus TaxID=81408 RepID=UPI001C4E0458|nr:helix-turn-helix domain-containing protein [Parageobacillus caldoxylosilyticus]QXJ39903.1 Helix-turn-helix domain protein [Parageobacillus caldoxylosilyticus]